MGSQAMTRAVAAIFLTAFATSDGFAHSGGLDANGCHAGSKPYHCHRAPSEMVGNRLRCDLGSRSKECIGSSSYSTSSSTRTSTYNPKTASPTRSNPYAQKAIAYSSVSTDLVLNIQRRLETLGVYGGPIDGIMGPRTALAIDVFKIKSGLPLDSQLDGETMQAMGLE
jgi:hypothetical protein